MVNNEFQKVPLILKFMVFIYDSVMTIALIDRIAD